MPYTARQRRYFHAAAERGEKDMKKLAAEADAGAQAGEELPPKKPEKKKRTLTTFLKGE